MTRMNISTPVSPPADSLLPQDATRRRACAAHRSETSGPNPPRPPRPADSGYEKAPPSAQSRPGVVDGNPRPAPKEPSSCRSLPGTPESTSVSPQPCRQVEAPGPALPSGNYQVEGRVRVRLGVRASVGRLRVANVTQSTDVVLRGRLTQDAQGRSSIRIGSVTLDADNVINLAFRGGPTPLIALDGVDVTRPFTMRLRNKVGNAEVHIKGHHRVTVSGDFALSVSFPSQIEPGQRFRPRVTGFQASPEIGGLSKWVKVSVDITLEDAGPHAFVLKPC